MEKPMPLIFVSHGSTMMAGEQCVVSDDWEETGRQAELRGVQGVVILGAHWEKSGENLVHVSTKESPEFEPMAWVDPEKYKNFKVNGSPALGQRVARILQEGGVDAIEDPHSNWIHDSIIPLKWMFPRKCPPATLISLNTKHDPALHSYIGSLIGPLRDESILIIGTGGAVHNLYRNNWPQVIIHRNNFAQELPPGQWAIDFRQAFFDVMTKGKGNNDGEDESNLRESVVRLMHHPLFRDAHATDDHYMAACFVAGAARRGEVGVKTSEVWELVNMCNSQFRIGSW